MRQRLVRASVLAAMVVVRSGRRTLRVKATDRAGNTDPTPAACSWTVDAKVPTVIKTRTRISSKDENARTEILAY